MGYDMPPLPGLKTRCLIVDCRLLAVKPTLGHMPSLNVHFLPQLVDPQQLAGSTCVVIDVLRATTTISYALDAGARDVIPCLEVDEARQVAATLPAGSCLLGGERGGKKIEGFDLGNSPAEYSAEVVGGKHVVFTTTNGTRSLVCCENADPVFLGSFVNAPRLAELLERQDRINLICAGTDGEITGEDALLAGFLVTHLRKHRGRTMNDSCFIAEVWWKSRIVPLRPDNLDKDVRERLDIQRCLEVSRGGKNLIELGMANDIEHASHFGCLQTVPTYRNGRITRLAVEPS